MEKLVIIGGSAGSLHVVFRILSDIRKDLPFPVVIVFHRHNTPESALEVLLSGKSVIPVREIEEKDPILPGSVYLCPADYHVLFEKDETFSLDASEKVHYSRPSIDVAFRSAADAFGEKVIGVLLSGANMDGADGLLYIQRHGGTSIVQDPAEAEVSFMPSEALKVMTPQAVLKSAEMGDYLNQLSGSMR